MISRLCKVLANPFIIPAHYIRKYTRLFGDRTYISLLYFFEFGKKINLDNPLSLNEKLNWLKLNDRNPLYTKLADKYEVKAFVSDVIGPEYVVPCLGVWDKVEDIDFSQLPQKFVIKGTHDSSGAIIVKDKSKLDIASVIKKYQPIQKRNYYWSLREWPYKEIKPRMIIDTFLDDNTSESSGVTLRDYKFWCFNGVPKYMYCTVKDTHIYENFFDRNFNPVNIDHGFPRHTPEFNKPKNYEKMWELAEKLAKASQTKWVRVDFFNVDGKIYFGEYTFFDWGGMRPFADDSQDIELGKLLAI